MTDEGTRITFLGTGDAFGSGGRMQCAIHVDDRKGPFLIDCGATALLAMKRAGLTADGVGTILVSHLHGDHLAGIPFILRETQILSRRTAPLVVAGPPGTEEMTRTLMKALFPGSWSQELSFDLAFVEMEPLAPHPLGELSVTLWPAVHTPMTNPHSIRVKTSDKIIAYSGDTEWNPHLVEAARGADLFICECFDYDGPKRNHLDYPTLLKNRHLLDAGRIVLTHMNDSMLERLETVAFECAYDGMTIHL